MKKTRADSKIRQLSVEQRALLEKWLFDANLSFEDAAWRCKEQFGLEVSGTVLGRWRDKREKEMLLDRTIEKVAQSAGTAEAQLKALAKLKDPFFEALMGQIGQQAFEAATRGESLDIETLGDLTEIAAAGLRAKTDAARLAQKDRVISQGEQKLQLELQKYKDAKEAIQREINAAKAAGGITPETLSRIEGELKLL